MGWIGVKIDWWEFQIVSSWNEEKMRGKKTRGKMIKNDELGSNFDELNLDR